MEHTLFPSVDEMLASEALSTLAEQPVTCVHCRPLHADYAKSGSRFLMLETNNGQGSRYILKRISPAWDWLVRATDDRLCRSVMLWQHGLFDRMPPEIEHGILACARDGLGWAILMRDVGAALVPYSRFSVADNECFLDAMAALHAAFFETPELTDPTLGLCTLRHVYTMFSPLTGHREAGGPYEIPQRILEGWDLVQTLVEPDVVNVLQELLDDPKPLCDALGRYPHTLVHGDWRHANQGLLRGERTRVVMLDWQLAAAASPSVELGRYLGVNSALLPVSKETALAYYRRRLAHRLGSRFNESWWRPQLELGLLGGFVQDAWAIALKATQWDIGTGARDRWRADLKWWSEQVRAGVRWL
jgi:hypothetical protein